MKIKNRKILVNGSVVIDTILGKNFFGGTGANIAYGLGQLKASPILFSLVGEDFKKSFQPHLEKSGINLRVHVEKSGKTASFACFSDNKNGLREIWEPNAYKKIHKISLLKTIRSKELRDVSIAIFSPGTGESTWKHLKEFRKFAPKALAIFDPGQMIEFYSKKQLVNCIGLADVFIINEFEYKKAKQTLGQDPLKFFSNKNKIIIKTKGVKGSVVFQNQKTTKINAVRPKRVLDPTGAGDAYRAGMIFSLWNGKSVIEACAFGAKIASKNVECIGGQQYKI